MSRSVLPKLSTQRALAAEWHPSHNGDLSPADVTLASNRKVWWRCRKDPAHEWEARIKNRAQLGNGCPFCSGRRATESTSLAALAPEVARTWDAAKNGDLAPSDVTCFSGHEVWWRCAKGHTFPMRIKERAQGKGCPRCAGRYPGSLAYHFPEIASEWHPTKNRELKPRDVKPASSGVAFWLCPEGHTYPRKIVTRTKFDRGCPLCKAKEKERGSLAVTHSALAREWHRAANGDRTPRQVAPGSHDRVTWRCSKDRTHVWEATVVKRTRERQGCPMCSGRIATPKTCLRAHSKLLAAEGHPTLNGDRTPDNVTPGSSRRVTWRCLLDSSHVWQALVHARALRGAGCPFCAGQRATDENSLAAKRPDIAAEWHAGLNGRLAPADITCRSARKVWWKCSAEKSHVFEASVEQRTRSEPAGARGRGSRGCPFCRGMRVPKYASLAVTHPREARAWDVVANTPLAAEGIAATSSRLVSWRCPKDQTRWRARVDDVTSGRVGCPRCTDDAVRSTVLQPASARRSKTPR